MNSIDLKNEILNVLETKLEQNNLKGKINSFDIRLFKGKVKFIIDGITEDLNMMENMFMKNFLVSKIKSELVRKHNDKKVVIQMANTEISFINRTINVDVQYSTSSSEKETYHYSL